MTVGTFLDMLLPCSFCIRVFDSSCSRVIYYGFKPSFDIRRRVILRFSVSIVPNSCDMFLFHLVV